MANIVVMPKVGISVESCIITKWHKSKGDEVKLGEIIFTYETDKASVEEEAKFEGTLLEILAQEGDDVPVLENVCIIGQKGEDISSLISAKKETIVEVVLENEQNVTVVSVPTSEVEIQRNTNVKVSPRAKRLAEKMGVDLEYTTGSGPSGRIIEKDVTAMIDSKNTFTNAALSSEHSGVTTGSGIGGKITIADLNQKPIRSVGAGDVEVVKLSNIRKVIAKSMVSSLRGMAQLTNNASFDATSMLAFKKELKDAQVEGITINDIILYAVSRTLKNHKDLNANLIDDSMHYFGDVNLGIAVDTPKGLLVPTLFGADKMTLSEISQKAKELIASAKDGSIAPDLLRGATFTITNLGSLGVESFTPVINPPQTGILGVCAIVDKVKLVQGQISLYKAMGLSLTYDHRAVDGAPAAKFIQELVKNLENIAVLLIK